MSRRSSMSRLILLCSLVIFWAGCGPVSQPVAEVDGPLRSGEASLDMESEAITDPDSVRFQDGVESNRAEDASIADLAFVDTAGNAFRVDRYRGDKNVLLVFTRGFAGTLCAFCTTQTSRLIANYDEFVKRDTEILLVYPGQTDQLEEFKAASTRNSAVGSFPFPVLLDENLEAVKKLDIVAQLAHPSTFIIDKDGSVKLAYVGSSPIDRPSIQSLLDHLDRLR